MRSHALWLILPLLVAAPLSAATVTGRVFLDANGDGAWQQNEDALPGALVSDGEQIVTCGTDGTYSLQTDESTVFVVNPTGAWPEKGFWRHLGAQTTGSDFPMIRQEQLLPFYFVQGTDLHIRPEIADKMATYVAAINSLPLPIAFVVHTGDLAVDTTRADVPGARALFEAYQKMVAGLKMPLFNVPGNHEHVAVAREDIPPDTPGWGKGLYPEYFGPMHYAFTYAGVQFIAVDGTEIAEGKMMYGIAPECLGWLEAYLDRIQKGTPIVMLIHEPFATLSQRASVENLLEGHKVILALSGHGHGIAYWDFAGGKEIMGGSTSYAWHGSGFGPNAMGYHLLKITADGFEDAFGDWAEKYPVTVDAPDRAQPITAPIAIRARFLDPAGEVTSAEVRIGDAAATVTEFGTEGLCRTLTTQLDPTGSDDCLAFLQITLTGKGEPMVEKQGVLVLTGRQSTFAAVGGAKLRMRLREVSAANAVLVNGVEVARMPADARDGDELEAEVPESALRRLNTIEVVSDKIAGQDKYDDFSVDQIEMGYDGRTYSDYRFPKGARSVVRSQGGEPGRATLYTDLTMPEG